jgi:hypothetical protein
VAKFPAVGIAPERADPVSVEGDADPFLLPPDDMTGDVRVVRLEDQIEALGDVVGASTRNQESAKRALRRF